MSLIDNTYFAGPLTIAQLGQPEVIKAVDLAIDLHEPAFLDAVLGYSLSKSFQAGIAEVSPAHKWLDIRDGVEYTNYSSYKRKWIGFVNSTTKVSPLANYVFYQYMENICMQTVGIGVVSAQSENSQVITPAPKMVYAWNRMVEYLQNLWDFLNVNQSTYADDGYVYSEINYRIFKFKNLLGI